MNIDAKLNEIIRENGIKFRTAVQYDKFRTAIKQLIADEIIGQDDPDDTNIMIAAEHAKQLRRLGL